MPKSGKIEYILQGVQRIRIDVDIKWVSLTPAGSKRVCVLGLDVYEFYGSLERVVTDKDPVTTDTMTAA